MSLLLAAFLAVTAAPPLSIDDAAQRARRDHPAIAATLRTAQAGVWAASAQGTLPEPRVMLSVSPLPVETRNGPVLASARLSQGLPWPGRLGAVREAAEARAAVGTARVALQASKVERAARLAHVAVALVRAEQAINLRAVALMERLVGLVQSRLAVDQASVTDVLSAEVRLARLQDETLVLKARAETKASALNLAMGAPIDALVGAVTPLAEPRALAMDTALTATIVRHPSLLVSDAALEAAGAAARRAAYAGRPSFEVGVAYTVVGEPEIEPGAVDAGGDALMFTVGGTLPVWGRYGAIRDAAEEGRHAAARRIEDTARTLEQQRSAQRVALESAFGRATRLRVEVLPATREALAVQEEGYRAGRIGFQRLIETERALEAFAVAHARVRADFARHLVELGYLSGATNSKETR